MRKIKFRGREIETGAWRMGYLFILGEGSEYQQTYILGHLYHQDSVYDVWKCAVEVDPETVGQFTGLYDKNGKMIFEGDIIGGDEIMSNAVYNNGSYSHTHYWVNKDIRHQVDFTPSSLQLISAYAKKFEIIGNIHDNPELRREKIMIKVPIEMPDGCLGCPFFIDKEYLYMGDYIYERIGRCQFAPEEIEDPWRNIHKVYCRREEWCPLEEVEEQTDSLVQVIARRYGAELIPYFQEEEIE